MIVPFRTDDDQSRASGVGYFPSRAIAAKEKNFAREILIP